MKAFSMNQRLVVMGVISVMCALLLGASQRTPSNPTPASGARATRDAGKPAWLVKWEETVKKAKAEGEVVIAGGSAAVEYRPVFDLFEKKFGITVKAGGGSSREIVDRILAERAAGRVTVDIMLSGGETLGQRMIPNNALAPIKEALILPEVSDGSYWYGGHLWFGTTDPHAKYVLTYSARVDNTVVSSWYNAKRLTPEDLQSIQSVWDLVNPRFAGMVVATAPDSTESGWDTLWLHPQIGERWYRRFFLPEFRVTFMSDVRVIADQMALGKFGMCLPCANVGTEMRKLQSLGAPLFEFGGKGHGGFKEQQFLTTGGSRSNLGWVDKAPHTNASKVFLNWFLSKEGQTAMHTLTNAVPTPTLRVDVTEMGLTNPGERRQPGRDYVELARIVPDYNTAHAKAMEQIRQMYYQSIRR